VCAVRASGKRLTVSANPDELVSLSEAMRIINERTGENHPRSLLYGHTGQLPIVVINVRAVRVRLSDIDEIIGLMTDGWHP